MDGISSVISRHACIGFDTSIFIYYVEDVDPYSENTQLAFDELERGTFTCVTSVVTLMELLVKPFIMGDMDMVSEYESLLHHYPHLTIAEFTLTIARRAAQLRAKYRLRPPDAMQVATALENGATAFITNDRVLRRVKEIEVVVLSDFIETIS